MFSLDKLFPDCQRVDFSYIFLPEGYELPEARPQDTITKQCVNRTMIGVPPKAPEEYKLPAHFPTTYNSEMFKYEDERYIIDLNIMKYKNVLRNLQTTSNLDNADDEKDKRLNKILKSNVYVLSSFIVVIYQKMVRQKYELEDHDDKFERLNIVIEEIQHDVMT